MQATMKYRLAVDLGSTSLGWAILRLGWDNQPCAVIKAGVRIFSDGRNAKDGSSLAVNRRNARAMRRRRDRLLKRKTRMMNKLLTYGFFPQNEIERKALETLNPYKLRAQGLDRALSPSEFARALFHINQRRGFKSNRKTDSKEKDSGTLKTAIQRVRDKLNETGCRTVGEWLYQRDHARLPTRARLRETKVMLESGKNKTEKNYDLYVDRAMIEHEFDILWQKQAEFNPALFNEVARQDLKDTLLFQRKLRPAKPGRCTLMPEQPRAPSALPCSQRFRIYQEVNNLRLLGGGLQEQPLTLEQRDKVVDALEHNAKQSFIQIKKLLQLGGNVEFNLEDDKRTELKGNASSAVLSKALYFGENWFKFSTEQQDEIVCQLLNEENEGPLIAWLQQQTGVDEANAERIVNVVLPEGYGNLCQEAQQRVLQAMSQEVISYDKAVKAAGFEHHSLLAQEFAAADSFNWQHVDIEMGEIREIPLLQQLPYYGKALQRHVGFGSGVPEDSDEKRYGKIANPTVHIGLNQLRLVVNSLIKRYGNPAEVIVEVARELKQSKLQRDAENKRQADNQKRNDRLKQDAAGTLQIAPEQVSRSDIEKLILWEELNRSNAADRRCPYSGVQICMHKLLSSEVEIEHILPYSRTLDDSLNNKTVAMRQANRIKANRTPAEAQADFAAQGWEYLQILNRASNMPKEKRYRFAEDGYQHWLKEDKDFLPRALNDTRYLSRIAREYLTLVSPNVRVIPGRMTAMLRAKFGLNDVLGLHGEKNRNDHRHHAVDACVIGVTDQGLLQRFAKASASTREKQLNKLVENMPLPWDSYREHVSRAIQSIWVSHRPDHSFEGAMHNDTAYGLRGDGQVVSHKMVEGRRERKEETLQVIEMTCNKATSRHGVLPDGGPKPYKGYKGDSNYCIEIVRNDKGKWEGEVISTFEAYQVVRQHGQARLRHRELSLSGKPLVMRLMRGDVVQLKHDNHLRTLRVCTISTSGNLALADVHEANVDTRTRKKELSYVFKVASSLEKAQACPTTISLTGEIVVYKNKD